MPEFFGADENAGGPDPVDGGFLTDIFGLARTGLGGFLAVEQAKVTGEANIRLAEAGERLAANERADRQDLIKWILGAAIMGGITALAVKKFR